MSSDNKDALLNEARAWAADDSDPNTLEALRRAIAAEDLDSIREGFDSPLEFGTAGLRGLLGFGINGTHSQSQSRNGHIFEPRCKQALIDEEDIIV